MVGYGAAHSSAFATLCERYRQRLFRAARRITRSHEDAEDAVQDALLNAFVHIGDFDGRSSLATWLTRIAINSALMILRKNRAAPGITLESNDDFSRDGLWNEICDRAPNPESRYAQREAQRILRKAVQRLRPTLRGVVQIQLQGRSMQEAAEAIGISLAAAKGRLFHAKAALRKSAILKLTPVPSKRKRSVSTEIHVTSTPAEAGEVSVQNSVRHEEVTVRAYEAYLERRGQPGCELDDWPQAESELQDSLPRGAYAGD